MSVREKRKEVLVEYGQMLASGHEHLLCGLAMGVFSAPHYIASCDLSGSTIIYHITL